jgi:hypothetical protein
MEAKTQTAVKIPVFILPSKTGEEVHQIYNDSGYTYPVLLTPLLDGQPQYAEYGKSKILISCADVKNPIPLMELKPKECIIVKMIRIKKNTSLN